MSFCFPSRQNLRALITRLQCKLNEKNLSTRKTKTYENVRRWKSFHVFEGEREKILQCLRLHRKNGRKQTLFGKQRNEVFYHHQLHYDEKRGKTTFYITGIFYYLFLVIRFFFGEVFYVLQAMKIHEFCASFK